MSVKSGKWLSKEKRLAIYRRDGCRCIYCGAEDNGRLSIDHVVPMSKVTNHDFSNLVTACVACNSRRGDMDVTKWIQIVARRHGLNAKEIQFRLKSVRRIAPNVKRAKQLLREIGFAAAMVA